MPRAKLILAVFTAALALSAIGTASASASMSWFVGGTKTSDIAKISMSTHWSLDENWLVSVGNFFVKWSCGGSFSAGFSLDGLDINEAEHITFTQCSEIEPSTCKIEPAEFETEPVTTLPTLALLPGSKKEETFLTFKPKSGNLFATITFTGSCSFAGEKAITGQVRLVAPGLENEEANHILAGLGSFENNSLELGGQKAFITAGKALVALASGAKWSFHE